MEPRVGQVEYHPLEPFLPERGRLLMLGSFPPQKKRWCMDFYYPNFQNDMWRVMGLAFYGDKNHFVLSGQKCFDRDRIIVFLQEKGIALYDTASAVRRLMDNASDNHLEVVIPTDIEPLLAALPACRAIVVTGEKAVNELVKRYKVQKPAMGSSVMWYIEGKKYHFYRMPSTSRAYPLALEKKAMFYATMLNEVLADDCKK